MNLFNNFFGGRGGNHGSDNDCCSIIWILFLLSACGNCNFNFCDIFNNDCIGLIILLLLLSSCCNGGNELGGCRG